MSAIASQITSLTIVYSIVYSAADQRKHQSSASLAFVRGIHRGPVNSPQKWPVTRKMFPFDDVIMDFPESKNHILCFGLQIELCFDVKQPVHKTISKERKINHTIYSYFVFRYFYPKRILVAENKGLKVCYESYKWKLNDTTEESRCCTHLFCIAICRQ